MRITGEATGKCFLRKKRAQGLVGCGPRRLISAYGGLLLRRHFKGFWDGFQASLCNPLKLYLKGHAQLRRQAHGDMYCVPGWAED